MLLEVHCQVTQGAMQNWNACDLEGQALFSRLNLGTTHQTMCRTGLTCSGELNTTTSPVGWAEKEPFASRGL